MKSYEDYPWYIDAMSTKEDHPNNEVDLSLFRRLLENGVPKKLALQLATA